MRISDWSSDVCSSDLDRFISSRILQPPQGWGGVEQFNARLEQVLAALHMGNQHPLEQTLRGGTQTMGNLFDRDLPEISAVKKMIEVAVAEYIDALPHAPEQIGRASGRERVCLSV